MTAPTWDHDLAALRARLQARIANSCDGEALRQVERGALGKRGALTELGRSVATLPVEERRAFGSAVAALKAEIELQIAQRQRDLHEAEVAKELADPSFDETLTGDPAPSGALHPLSLVRTALEDLFAGMGFHVLDYPEVESEFNNFEALNIPSWHPARDMQDTFWIAAAEPPPPAGDRSPHVLRTHTSAGQVRTMLRLRPPFRAVFPGRVFRYEAVDASHEHTFHQVEGLLIDREVSVGHLLDAMRTLLSALFEEEVPVRLRPGYFPFVEPGFELDIRCRACAGAGCQVCKHSGWLELMPCGLVHPNVLRMGGLDPEQWQGWAFGLGLSRLVMMRHGIHDIRLLLGGDARLVEPFAAGSAG